MKGKVDPLKKYPDVKKGRLVEACGLIPAFVAEAEIGLGEGAPLEALHRAVMEIYGYGLGHPMTGGEVTPEGVYTYPEDPDLYPLVSLQTAQGHEVLIYQYAITAFRDSEGTTIVERID